MPSKSTFLRSRHEHRSHWRLLGTGTGLPTSLPCSRGPGTEAAGCVPLLTHAAEAKVMICHVNKPDELGAAGLATLLGNGTLPTVWLTPGSVRDESDQPRTRIALSRLCTAFKSRI